MESEAQIYEAVARGWCHDANSAKEMDVLLGEAIAIEVLKVIRPLVAERDALAAENVRLREALEADQVGHIIEFREDGWTIQHPLSCRPNLFDCPVNRAAERDLDEPPECGPGRYTCGVEDGGRFWYDGGSYQPLQPPTASPSAPEGVAGDSEPKP